MGYTISKVCMKACNSCCCCNSDSPSRLVAPSPSPYQKETVSASGRRAKQEKLSELRIKTKQF